MYNTLVIGGSVPEYKSVTLTIINQKWKGLAEWKKRKIYLLTKG